MFPIKAFLNAFLKNRPAGRPAEYVYFDAGHRRYPGDRANGRSCPSPPSGWPLNSISSDPGYFSGITSGAAIFSAQYWGTEGPDQRPACPGGQQIVLGASFSVLIASIALLFPHQVVELLLH